MTPYHFFYQEEHRHVKRGGQKGISANADVSPLNKKSDKGFIALISVLIIGAILSVLMFTVSTSAFYARFDSLGAENKRTSLALAESCINVGLLMLASSTDPLTEYNGTLNKVVTVGTDYQGDPTTCTIQKITHPAGSNVFTIDTQAEYNDSYSNVNTKVSVPDPAAAAAVDPLPTCALTASPSSVPQGQDILLQWATSNANAFEVVYQASAVDAEAGEVEAGSESVEAWGVGSVTFTGTATGSGGQVQCTATVTVTSPPPAPACADTVMMLDRTGSMQPVDLTNERDAAKTLVDLYEGVDTSDPKVGVGSFPAYDNSAYASVPVSPLGQLSSAYTTLKSTIDTFTANSSCSGSFCGTNIAEAIKRGYQELNSIRHTAGFRKVLILISDGEANRPSGNVTNDSNAALNESDTAKVNDVDIFTVRYSTDTNTAATLLMAQLATGDTPVSGHLNGADDDSMSPLNTSTLPPSAVPSGSWQSPTLAYVDDGAYTTSMTTLAQQRFSTFGLSGITSNVSGIEVTVDGLVKATVNTGNKLANGVGNYNGGWSGVPQNNSAGRISAVAGNDGAGSYIASTVSGNAQTFGFANAGIPAGSTINSVTVTAVAAKENLAGNPTFKIRAEKGIGAGQQNDSADIVLNNTTYTTFSNTWSADPFTGAAWTLAEVNAWTTKFGVVRGSAGGTVSARVTQLYVTVNYSTATLPPNCQVSVELSDNGTTWTTGAGVGIKPITLTGAETTYVVGSSTDTWGRSWTAGNVTGSNFSVRLTNDTCSGLGSVASVDSVKVKAYYTAYNTTEENNDGDNYFITPSTNLSSIEDIFETIGKKVCPAAAAQCGNTVDDDADGLIDEDDPTCHVGGTLAGAYDPDINDEYAHPAPPAPPSAPPPPPPINLGAWEEIPQ